MPGERIRLPQVSCRSCRSKKLKCNRVQPCSNCTARNIVCNFVAPPQQPHGGSTSKSPTTSELLKRIEELEAIASKQSGLAGANSTSTPEPNHIVRQQSLYHNLQIDVTSSLHQRQDEDSRMIENVGIRDDSLLSRLSNGLTFQISSGHDILPLETSHLKDIVVTFPKFRIAELLLRSYESNVDYLCHILHLPTIRTLLRTLYLAISQGESVLPGQAALILSVFAIAAYFYRPFDNAEVARTKQEAVQLSKGFSISALDVLDYSRRNTSGALEDVQAYVLMSFVTYHLDGFSARGRILSTTALSMARELRLHRLDAEAELPNTQKDDTVRSLIDLEVKRRVFWQITSTDWLLSFISGPQEGTYFIHPNHIDVHFPRNCTDDDFIVGEDNSMMDPQPTPMSFSLERLRLAHLCREMTDVVPLETSKLLQLPYDQIISLDNKLQDFLSNLPFFFRTDPESRQRSKALETIYPKIIVSRYCITTEAHSRRCKLHQKFLLRQSVDSRYAYSRQAGLESARAVVQGFEYLRQHECATASPELMGTAGHSTHLALVVMVMDLCFNRDEADEVERKAEVRAALQMFEDTKSASPLLGRFLTSLKDALKVHRVDISHCTRVVNDYAERSTMEHVELMPDAFDMPLEVDHGHFSNSGVDMMDPTFQVDASFDEFWDLAMQREQTTDSVTWDNLFSNLDARPV